MFNHLFNNAYMKRTVAAVALLLLVYCVIETNRVVQESSISTNLADVENARFLPPAPHKLVVANQLLNLILNVTGINNTNVVKLMKETLTETEEDLTENLVILKEFAEKYACATCVDSRPLPKTAVDIRVRLASTGTWHGVPAPVMTFRPLGRLGNLMGEYASLYALKNYSVTSFLMPSLHKDVKDVFKRLSIPYLNKCINTEGYAQACPPCSGILCRIGMTSKKLGIPVPSMFEDKDWISIGGDFGWVEYSYQAQQLAAAGLLGPHAFIMEDYPLEITSFAAYRDELRKEFEFLDEIQKKVYDRLAAVAASATKEDPSKPLVFVGVHVRLTDYPHHMSILFSVDDLDKSYEGYLRRAFTFFTDKFDNVVFVVASDDVVATANMTKKLAFPNTFVSQGETEVA
ncbi:galactoside alpha-(1,2)-fucosyltransferase 2 [Hyalella azteca]|uniref:L-Fucosyltransferase n=1 Tax=Hyalella azteca TaxID=294128 RepID=A0A8B7PAV0_HYAAZ|nr:galactoside alpha-(1,2)-fucosyltransferase 2 [Hyalella azteca]